MCIILGFLILAQVVVSAPVVNPYDKYNLTTYNCLDIALETQEWYEFNGIETTVFIGCFNDTLCHAWLEAENGNKIIGYVPGWKYNYTYVWDERTEVSSIERIKRTVRGEKGQIGPLEERQSRITAILADFHERQAEIMTGEAIRKREDANIARNKLVTLHDYLNAMMNSMICQGVSPWRRYR
jgi:hypothetical protein